MGKLEPGCGVIDPLTDGREIPETSCKFCSFHSGK